MADMALGTDTPHLKEWLSACGNYKIVWRDTYAMVPVRPHYHVLVLAVLGDSTYWEFAGRRGRYYSFKQCEAAVRRHQRVWGRFVKLSRARGNRVGRLKEWKEKARHLCKHLPQWVAQEADPSLVRQL